ncbi:hypothetical protein RND81_03G006100 [Saponaria officinalis]|uniref:Pectinesterase inhibitor domain-containing protein n=1 Tax=Saponaria officinalis TaxID=3572 RepID=A0AAW1M2C0_SAPOF
MDTSLCFIHLFFLIYFLFFVAHRPCMSIGATRNEISNVTVVIQQVCRATRFQDACLDTLSSSDLINDGSNSSDVIQAAFSATSKNIDIGLTMVKFIPNLRGDDNINRTFLRCQQCLTMSKNRTSSAIEALSKNKLRDSRAWLSGTMTYLHDCVSQLSRLSISTSNTTSINSLKSYINNTLIVSTSNVLSMLWGLDTYGADPMTWTQVHTEREGVWERVEKPIHIEPVFDFGDHTPDVTVCKNASIGCFTSVQSAIDVALKNLAGENRFVIKIKEGVYSESVYVPFDKANLMWIGDGIGKTVITSSSNTTAYILGDGFFATDITFENTAGPNASQGTAFETHSDFSYVQNCEFLSNRASLYAHSNRQFFNSCRIEGNDDLIAGNATVIFHKCTILVRPRQSNPINETNVIAAHGRLDPAQTTGFVFNECLINGTNDYMKLYHTNSSLHNNYLGRPWNAYSRTVYINCTMEALISPGGWAPLNGDFALSTLYYGEFGNSGVGANSTKRVPWSRQIPEQHITTYSIEQFLQGDEWILIEY